MKNIILTSTGFENPEIMKKVQEFFGDNIRKKRVAIITTASIDKEKNEFAALAYSQFFDMGLESVVFFDIEMQNPEELLQFDVIYVNGGNTYFLLHWAKKSGFDRVAIEFVRRGGLYIGVSAGSLIAGPSIEVINYTGGDENSVGLKDFSGFGFINKAVVPHYDREVDEKAILKYEKLSGLKVARLTDKEALFGGVAEEFYLIK